MKRVSNLRRYTKSVKVELTGGPLSIANVVDVARKNRPIVLSLHAQHLIETSRRRVDACVDSGHTYYGINTGFGSLVSKTIDREQIDALQINLVRSHASGVGAPLPKDIVRSMLLCLVGSLSRGLSGVRVQVVEHLIHLINLDYIPVVPSIGSVGASGDLAPLAHAIQVLMGEGKVMLPDGVVCTGEEALEKAGLPKISFVAKEGLGLINGTHLMCGSAALACNDYVQTFKSALCAIALTLEACQSSHGFLDPRINSARVFHGGRMVARVLRSLVEKSEIHAQRKNFAAKVQDPYSIRCVPPVLGASWEAYLHVREAIETELGAVTDNPLVFCSPLGETEIISAGNFHGMPIALPLDILVITLTHLAAISERRTNLMLSNSTWPMLAVNPGVESGMMICQYTQAACINELQGLSSPASVNNVPTCANVEDYNSFGPRSAAKAMRALELCQYVIAVEFLCGAERLERMRPHAAGEGVEEIFSIIRSKVSKLETDRSLTDDINVIRDLMRGDAFDHLVTLR